MRPWFPDRMARLDRVAALERGWVDDAPPPASDAVECARRLLAVISILQEIRPQIAPQIVPTSDGGVQIEWHEQGWNAEVGVTATGDFDAWAWHEASGREFSYPPDTDAVGGEQ